MPNRDVRTLILELETLSSARGYMPDQLLDYIRHTCTEEEKKALKDVYEKEHGHNMGDNVLLALSQL